MGPTNTFCSCALRPLAPVREPVPAWYTAGTQTIYPPTSPPTPSHAPWQTQSRGPSPSEPWLQAHSPLLGGVQGTSPPPGARQVAGHSSWELMAIILNGATG